VTARSARLSILAAAVLWSTAGAAIKLCSLGALEIATGRSAVAAAVLFLFLPGARRWPSRRVLAVASAYAATVLLFVMATKRTTAANAIFIQDSAPLWVLAFSVLLLRERPTRDELVSVPIFLAALCLFFLDRLSPGQMTGNLLALAAGVAFGLTIVGLRGIDDRAAALSWGNVIAVLVGLPFVLDSPAPLPLDVAILLFLGVFQLGLAYALFARGIQGTSAVEASLLVLLEPVLNPIWAFLLTGERPGPWGLTGGAIILAATAWRVLRQRPGRPPQPA
jgi:drug/metabolite transporter, DME family